MATIRPFQPLRPPTEKAAAVAAVPYDVVNTDEARQLAAGNPLSFLHVSRPEIDLADGTDPYSDVVYQKAADNFADLKRKAPLSFEPTPSLYVYRLQMGQHVQSGIAACCSIDEYDANIIRKHERTRKDKEDDRTRHMLTLRAQTGPVLMTYRGNDEIDDAVSHEQNAEPLYDFTAADGIRHTIWRASDDGASKMIEGFRTVPRLYIADGHHRAASASRARAELQSLNPIWDSEEEANFFLSVLFPSDQLQILPYNRIVRNADSFRATDFVRSMSEQFELSEAASASPRHKGEICAYVAGKWYSLTLPPGTTSPIDPIASLDVTILEERLLAPVLAIRDVRSDKRIDFVGGIRGTAALERIVNEGRADVAFSMFPVKVDDLMAIADAREIMPPKSTWFEPKLRDGLLSHVI